MNLKKFALRGMIILAVVIGLCILFSGTIRTLTTPKVRFAKVKMGKLETVTELTGQVAFPDSEKITVQVPEGQSLTVTGVLVSPGTHVYAGTRLVTMKVTGAEKTLEDLQNTYETARKDLDNWTRKNSNIRLSRNEELWMAAYEKSREADRTEQNARLELLMALEPMGIDKVPETLPEKSDEYTVKCYTAWEEAVKTRDEARKELQALDRYAIADDVWELLEKKKELERKIADSESQMMDIQMLIRKVEVITAPHDGYIASVSVEKNGTVPSGNETILTITPADKDPVIRADTSEVKQTIQKGTSVRVETEYWRPETRIINTGLDDAGHPYADAEITEDIIYALGQISTMMQNKVTLRMTTKAQQSTCLIPASAVRGDNDGRYVYVANQEESAFAGKKITVSKMPVKVLQETASTVSVDEDLSYYKIIYMEDRFISEGDTVMQYEE